MNSPMQRVGVGVVGAGWMGNAHAAGYRRLQELWPSTDQGVELVVVADVDPAAAQATATRFGFQRAASDWRDVVADPDVDIVDVTGPNDMHAEVVIAAARAGKAVSCEKPLGRDLGETRRMASEVTAAGVPSQVGFSYRLVPGVRFARSLLAAGELGDIRHVRCWFLTDYGFDPQTPFSWRYDQAVAGTGAIGDLGAHVVEMVEGLAGPVSAVAAAHERFIESRPDLGHGASHFAAAENTEAAPRQVTNDDSFAAVVRFECDALGTIEASRVLGGPRAAFGFEVYGSRGAVAWNLERMNEIQLFDASLSGAKSGFATVLSGPSHPGFSPLSPGPGVGLSWQDLKTLEAHELVGQVRGVERRQAGADLGLRVAEVLDAIERGARQQRWVTTQAAEA